MNGEEHKYGHTALRIKSALSDKTYDFGRYGQTSGMFGERGEGILRVWSNFQSYITGEIAIKRKTTGFVYAIFDYQATATNTYFDELTKSGKKLAKSTPTKKVYKLTTDYYVPGPNCTTVSIDGARRAIPSIDSGSEKFNKPEDVLSLLERGALFAAGDAHRLFLPANLLTLLNTKQPVKPIRVDVYGVEK